MAQWHPPKTMTAQCMTSCDCAWPEPLFWVFWPEKVLEFSPPEQQLTIRYNKATDLFVKKVSESRCWQRTKCWASRRKLFTAVHSYVIPVGWNPTFQQARYWHEELRMKRSVKLSSKTSIPKSDSNLHKLRNKTIVPAFFNPLFIILPSKTGFLYFGARCSGGDLQHVALQESPCSSCRYRWFGGQLFHLWGWFCGGRWQSNNGSIDNC